MNAYRLKNLLEEDNKFHGDDIELRLFLFLYTWPSSYVIGFT